MQVDQLRPSSALPLEGTMAPAQLPSRGLCPDSQEHIKAGCWEPRVDPRAEPGLSTIQRGPSGLVILPTSYVLLLTLGRF